MKHQFEPLELNEENLFKILKECQYIPGKSKLARASLYIERDGYDMAFDSDKLKENLKNIYFMYGQTIVAHSYQTYYDFTKLGINYKNEYWTTNPKNLALYIFLCIATGDFSPIHETGRFSPIHDDPNIIDGPLHPVSTLSPNDPNFEEWWKEHREEWENK